MVANKEGMSLSKRFEAVTSSDIIMTLDCWLNHVVIWKNNKSEYDTCKVIARPWKEAPWISLFYIFLKLSSHPAHRTGRRWPEGNTVVDRDGEASSTVMSFILSNIIFLQPQYGRYRIFIMSWKGQVVFERRTVGKRVQSQVLSHSSCCLTCTVWDAVILTEMWVSLFIDPGIWLLLYFNEVWPSKTTGGSKTASSPDSVTLDSDEWMPDSWTRGTRPES
jgi:hypothetical protein